MYDAHGCFRIQYLDNKYSVTLLADPDEIIHKGYFGQQEGNSGNERQLKILLLILDFMAI